MMMDSIPNADILTTFRECNFTPVIASSSVSSRSHLVAN